MEDRVFKARIMGGLCAALALAACTTTTDMPSRGLTTAAPAVVGLQPGGAMAAPLYNVVAFDAVVPRNLLVSEADVYLPRADIVWHGDPVGDRYAQIETIFESALAQSTADMTQGRAVEVVVQVEKFHGVTDKTRATVGGNFGMHFYLTVLDAETGALIDGPRLVVADTPAAGGIRALREEQRGITQKSVVLARLIQVLDLELAKPASAPQDNLSLTLSRDDFSPLDIALAE
jgi:hypothetical protein